MAYGAKRPICRRRNTAPHITGRGANFSLRGDRLNYLTVGKRLHPTSVATTLSVPALQHGHCSASILATRAMNACADSWAAGLALGISNASLASLSLSVLHALAPTEGVTALLARLLYSAGMRLMGGMHPRVKDVDFDRQAIIVREAKGNKDRVVMLPRSLMPELPQQMLVARSQWEADRQAQRGGVETPYALESKYPRVGYTWAWFWIFPSPTP